MKMIHNIIIVLRKLGAKESDHYEVFSKRGKKFTTQSSSTTSSENPLLG